MLPTKEFKFVRNILWPFPTTLKVSDTGIENKGKLTRWEDISDFSHGIMIINGANSYQVVYKDKGGKRNVVSFTVAVTGKKSKKQMFAEVYDALATGFDEKLVKPRAEEIAGKLRAGGEVELNKCKLNKDGIEIRVGTVKKSPQFVAWTDTSLERGIPAGGFSVGSSKEKGAMGLVYQNAPDSRVLEQVVHLMNPMLK